MWQSEILGKSIFFHLMLGSTIFTVGDSIGKLSSTKHFIWGLKEFSQNNF